MASYTVLSGQTSSGITLNTSDSLAVLSGGTVVSTTVNSGGYEFVAAEGLDVSGTINNGGLEGLYGSATGLVVTSGGTETVGSGGVTSGATINAGGVEVVSSAGTAMNAVINGGTLELQSGAHVSGPIGFKGTGGELMVSGSTLPTVTISGFIQGDTIDLANVAYAPTASATITTGNSVQVTAGGQTYNLQLNPSQSLGSDQALLSQDSTGGTIVSLSPALQLIGSGEFGWKPGIAWQAGGQLTLWQNGSFGLAQTLVANGELGAGWSVAGLVNFEYAGNSDVVWDNGTGGQVTIWEMNGASVSSSGVPAGQMGAGWSVAAVGDFAANGNADILWHNNTNQVAVWYDSGTSLASSGTVNGTIGAEWKVAATGDFFQTGGDGVLWEDSQTGDLSAWSLSGTNVADITNVGQIGAGWEVAGVGQFAGLNNDGDPLADIVWVNTNTNAVQIWQMSGGQIAQTITPEDQLGSGWSLQGVGDFTSSGDSELLWTASGGAAQIWQLNGAQVNVVNTVVPAGITETPTNNVVFTGTTPSTPSSPSTPSTPSTPSSPTTPTSPPTTTPTPAPVLVTLQSAPSGAWTIGGIYGTQAVGAGQAVANPVIGTGVLELTSGATVEGTISFTPGGTGILYDADQAAHPDTVVGFSEGSNHLSFAGQSAATEAQVIASAQVAGGNTLLTLPDSTSILLAGVTHVDIGIFT